MPLPLHCGRPCRRSLNFAHVPVVHDSHLTIAPGDRNRIPTYFGDMPAISGIASPINTVALPKAFRFGDCHCCGTHQLATLTQFRCGSC